jgi:hypothetical protein
MIRAVAQMCPFWMYYQRRLGIAAMSFDAFLFFFFFFFPLEDTSHERGAMKKQ